MDYDEKQLRWSAAITGVIGWVGCIFLVIGLTASAFSGHKWTGLGLSAIALLISFLAISALFEIAAALRSKP